MEERLYESFVTVKLKDGTTKQVKKIRRYTPKVIKEFNKSYFYKEIPKITDVETLRKLRDIIEEHKNARRLEMDNVEIPGEADQEV